MPPQMSDIELQGDRRHTARRRADVSINDEVTLGELHRRMSGVEAEMHRGFSTVAERIASLSFVHVERYEADRRTDLIRFEQLAAENREIHDRITWVARAIAGSLITAAVGAVVALSITGALN